MNPLSEDLKELVSSLTAHGVEFLVVGAHALAFHAIPRQTMDLDLWVRKSRDNVGKLQAALTEFGFPITDGMAATFLEERKFFKLGVEPNRVDILNFLDGTNFDLAWVRRQAGKLQGIDTNFLAIEDYVKTKIASGRPKDLLDLELLREQLGSPLPGEGNESA